MAKKIVSDLDLKGKVVLERADFNVPLKNGEITNDNRIVQALPTIKYILEQGGKLVLFSHLGKVKEESDKKELTLKPVATGSLTEVTVVLEKEVTVEDVNKAMKNAADESFGYTEDEIVSSDIVGMNFGSLFDATQTRVISVGDKQLVKVAAWYDNEMSYTSQLVRTLEYLAELTK